MGSFIAMNGATSALAYLAGQTTALAAEWASKTASGDPAPLTTYLMLLGSVVVDSQTTMSTLASLEVTGTGYARQPVSWAVPSPTTRSIANSVLIQFGPFADPSGLNTAVNGAALVTRMSGTSGLCLMTWALASGLTTTQNQALQISASSLSMTLATS